MTELDNWLTVPEAARVLNTYENKIRRLAKAGKLTAVRRGGKLWIDRRTVETYKASLTTETEDGDTAEA